MRAAFRTPRSRTRRRSCGRCRAPSGAGAGAKLPRATWARASRRGRAWSTSSGACSCSPSRAIRRSRP
eukprot:8753698-Lingulodinium_polyedra.AAC.1